MKNNVKKIIGVFLLTAVFLSSNLLLTNGSYSFGKHTKGNLVYASPKRSGGFKSGSFKSISPKSGGFKSGIFKSSKPKQNGSSGSSNSGSGFFSGNKNSTSTHTRSFIPFFIPWGGGHSFGAFGFVKFVFYLILIVIIIAIILKFMRRRK